MGLRNGVGTQSNLCVACAVSYTHLLSASVSQYSFAETEDLQANDLRNFAYTNGAPYQSSGGQTRAGFGAMDWSEASYYGLNAANLQNADQQFVSPSQSSIDAALGDATTLPDGVISYLSLIHI